MLIVTKLGHKLLHNTYNYKQDSAQQMIGSSYRYWLYVYKAYI